LVVELILVSVCLKLIVNPLLHRYIQLTYIYPESVIHNQFTQNQFLLLQYQTYTSKNHVTQKLQIILE